MPIRAGSDIAFLGGIVHYIIENERYFRDYVVHYTNAPAILSEDFRDTEDLDGLFSGWDDEKHTYDPTSWAYEGDVPSRRPARGVHQRADSARTAQRGALDPTLQHPRCVFQILKRHFARYTPEMVEEVCGVPRELFLAVAETLCDNSGRERTSAFCYAVGWTQHTVGVQYIRTAAIIQLLLGNIGRPGRRHPGAARTRLDPGLDRHPDALQPAARLSARCRRRRPTPRSTSTSANNESTSGLVERVPEVRRLAAEGVVRRRTPPRRTTGATTTCRG